MSLDELLLPRLQITYLLVHFHFLLVVGGLVLNSSIKEEAELVCLMDAVDQHSE